MISDSQLPELSRFKEVEATLPLRPDPTFANCVVPLGNERLPVHRWFRFKESFSADFTGTLLSLLRPALGRSLRLLDPFCGVGTALVASQELAAAGYRIDAIGIELNPFIAFAAKTKVNWPHIRPDAIDEAVGVVFEDEANHHPKLPGLSSFTRETCVSRHTATRLLAVRDAISTRVSVPVVRDALLLGLAASLDALSKVRKDGRALRIVEKPRIPVREALVSRWSAMSADVRFMQGLLGVRPAPAVILGDGRNPLKSGIAPSSIDLILTSPPYPNTIDYTEVYKLELWLLGLVTTSAEFFRLRSSTFRSHPTTTPAQPADEFGRAISRGRLRQIMSPLRERTAKHKWRHRLVLGYFSDTWDALRAHFACLRRGGYAVYVVGNSLHGGKAAPYLIPTDLVLPLLAERVGFSIETARIARSLPRRLSGNHFLRDSVVVLRKP